jgi:hypothetical protein
MMRIVRWTIAGLFVPLLLLAGCSSGSDPTEPVQDSFVLPSGTKELGQSGQPSRSITGRLGFDDIEGGCAYLETDDGTKVEVIYPEGWAVDRATGMLSGPDGQHAAAGDIVTVRGSVATDRSSICQIGPIFVATEVTVGS